MIRFIGVILFLIVYLIVSSPIMIAELIIEKFNMNFRNITCLKWVKFGFRCVLFISGVKTEVYGLDNIPKDQAVLYVGNHRSYFDIVSTYPLMKRPTGYVAKKEMLRYPFLSWLMYFVNCLFLDRDDPRAGLKTINKGADFIKNGISMVIFPEGTRIRTPEMAPFKEGSLKMATKAKCPIIPMGIVGSSAVFEDQSPCIKPGKIVISFGEPIYTADLSRDELRTLTATVQSRVAELIESGKQQA